MCLQNIPLTALLPCQLCAVVVPHPRVERGKTFLMAAATCWASCSTAPTPGNSRTSSGRDSSSKVTWGGQAAGMGSMCGGRCRPSWDTKGLTHLRGCLLQCHGLDLQVAECAVHLWSIWISLDQGLSPTLLGTQSFVQSGAQSQTGGRPVLLEGQRPQGQEEQYCRCSPHQGSFWRVRSWWPGRGTHPQGEAGVEQIGSPTQQCLGGESV